MAASFSSNRVVRWFCAGAVAVSLLAPGCASDGELESTSYWVSEPAESTRSSLLVVFVHGVMGDSKGTWLNTKTANSFPRMVQTDPALKGADVFVYGYRSTPLAKSSSIPEIAGRMMQGLRDLKVFDRYETIVFVVHSMGGLITKEAIIASTVAGRENETKRIRGVIFLSTPAQGSSLAQVAQWVSGNPQFKGMEPSEMNSYLQALDDNWQRLVRGREAARSRPVTACAYETLSMGAHVVPRLRAERFCDSDAIAFDHDHLSIVKPASPGEPVYQWVRARIIEARDFKLPITVEFKVLSQRKGELSFGDTLKSGDLYWIELNVSPKVWLYVVNTDGSGKASRYYPPMAAWPDQPVQGSVRIPPERDRAIELDDTVGIESFFVFARHDRDVDLESRLQNVALLGKKSSSGGEAIARQLTTLGGREVELNPSTQSATVHTFMSNQATLKFSVGHQ